MKAVIAATLLLVAMLALANPGTTTSYYFHMVADGSVYCYAPDGHIFRPRNSDFIMTVPSR